MQTFIDPYPFSPTKLQTDDAKFSPDDKFFAVVTQRGVLSTNELECTVWVFEVDAVQRFLDTSEGAAPPKPKAVARMGAVANEPSVTQLRWLPDGKLAFLGRDKTSDRNLFTVNVNTGELKKVTPNGQDVTQYDFVKNTVAYTVALRMGRPLRRSETVITGHTIISQLEGESSTTFPQLGTPAELWVIRSNRPKAVIDPATAKPIQLITDILSLSPSGRFVAVTKHADRVPDAWAAYEPAFPGLSDTYRLKASPPVTAKDDLLSRLRLPKQYALIDLETGKSDMINAPLGENLLYQGPNKAIWSIDSHRVLLLNTFLPLENTDETQKRRRGERPCVVVVDVRTHDATCVAFVKQGGLEQYFRDGTLVILSDVTWNQARGEVTLKYQTSGAKQGSGGPVDQTETYRLANGVWKTSIVRRPHVRAPFQAAVHQDLNEAPSVFVSDWTGGHGRKLWEPNPQLKAMDLGQVSEYEWQDKTGRNWIGGLVKPPNYIPGRRYPLVIQTHGFRRHEFMTVGTFTTAFAARPLATTGIVVLQVQDASDLIATPQEASVNVYGYEAAIDHLAADGLVDRERVGLIGFSRTGYYTLEALTKSPKLFAAATIADSEFLGYMQGLLGVDLGAKKEGIAIYGSQPFGDGLNAWIKNAPAFNLDKIDAPLRVEVHDLLSVLMNWEVYAGLRLQDKPVDLIRLPDATHIVTKPLERLASEQGDVDWFDFWLNGREDPDVAKAEQYARWRLFREHRKENTKP